MNSNWIDGFFQLFILIVSCDQITCLPSKSANTSPEEDEEDRILKVCEIRNKGLPFQSAHRHADQSSPPKQFYH